MTVPALSRAEKDDMNAAIVEHFDPVHMTLPQIEAMQKMLSETAARRRAEAEGPPEHDTETPFMELRTTDWKEAGDLESLVQVEDELEPFDEDEDHWRDL